MSHGTTTQLSLETWTIYDRPSDYPDHFVVRRFWIVPKERGPKPDPHIRLAPTLESARALVPEGLERIPRAADDDPVIVETWV